MTDSKEEYNAMVKELSDLRDKLRGMTAVERGKFMSDYINGDFTKDIAMLSGISVKIYAYLGWEYYADTIKNIEGMIKMFKNLDKISF